MTNSSNSMTDRTVETLRIVRANYYYYLNDIYYYYKMNYIAALYKIRPLRLLFKFTVCMVAVKASGDLFHSVVMQVPITYPRSVRLL